ncbi:unnamed protein product [Lactuca saligna]|uniref:Uncharacterized protein n=1 Tax=Lactuca saligna TaxID=75948 RepID=A0AA35ZE27_LACSI|nr:unnamed protein product [Lactuca saligna]
MEHYSLWRISLNSHVFDRSDLDAPLHWFISIEYHHLRIPHRFLKIRSCVIMVSVCLKTWKLVGRSICACIIILLIFTRDPSCDQIDFLKVGPSELQGVGKNVVSESSSRSGSSSHIAPVIHEWTYDAMCHDLLEMEGNKYVHVVMVMKGKRSF